MLWTGFFGRRAAACLIVAALAAATTGPRHAAAEEVMLPGPKGPAVALEGDCHPIDFEMAEVVRKGSGFVLRVKGHTPEAGMTVAIVAVMYVMMPEYWRIILMGCRSGEVAAQVLVPFDVEFELGGSIGRRGIHLVGASPGSDRRIDVPHVAPAP